MCRLNIHLGMFLVSSGEVDVNTFALKSTQDYDFHCRR